MKPQEFFESHIQSLPLDEWVDVQMKVRRTKDAVYFDDPRFLTK